MIFLIYPIYHRGWGVARTLFRSCNHIRAQEPWRTTIAQPTYVRRCARKGGEDACMEEMEITRSRKGRVTAWEGKEVARRKRKRALWTWEWERSHSSRTKVLELRGNPPLFLPFFFFSVVDCFYDLYPRFFLHFYVFLSSFSLSSISNCKFSLSFCFFRSRIIVMTRSKFIIKNDAETRIVYEVVALDRKEHARETNSLTTAPTRYY